MQLFNIILLDDVIADLQNGIDYYKSISPGLGKKFLIAVKSTFAELKKNPFYQVRYDNVRMRTVKRFPYVLHFIVKERQNTVEIYGVRHSAKNPDTSYIFNI